MTTDQIVKIINNINNNKALGFDDVSVKMIKLCPELISIPLKIIFEKCIQQGAFPDIWKRANVQPVHKKSSRQLKTNYRPISLLFSSNF